MKGIWKGYFHQKCDIDGKRLDPGVYPYKHPMAFCVFCTRAQLLEGRLALKPGFFFLCSKAFSRVISPVIFRASNHQQKKTKELKLKYFLSFQI